MGRCVGGWVGQWVGLGQMTNNCISPPPNRDNSIMDILDIFLDILLKPPQPLMGLFLLVPLREMALVKGTEALRNRVRAILAQQVLVLLQLTESLLSPQRRKGKKVLKYSLGFPCCQIM